MEKEALLRLQLSEIRAQIEAKRAEMRVEKLTAELAAANEELKRLKQSTPEPAPRPASRASASTSTGSNERLVVP